MVVGERENPEQEPFPTTHASEHIETLCHGALPPLYRAVFCTGHTSKAVLQETLWSGFGVEAGLFQPRLRAALHPAADGEHFGLTPERLQSPPHSLMSIPALRPTPTGCRLCSALWTAQQESLARGATEGGEMEGDG